MPKPARPAALLALLLAAAAGAGPTAFPTYGPFTATAGDTLTLGNDAIGATWTVAGGKLKPATVKAAGRTLPMGGEAFELVMADGNCAATSRRTSSANALTRIAPFCITTPGTTAASSSTAC